MAKLNGNTKRSIRIGISLIRQGLVMAFEKTSLINLLSVTCPYCTHAPDSQDFLQTLPSLSRHKKLGKKRFARDAWISFLRGSGINPTKKPTVVVGFSFWT